MTVYLVARSVSRMSFRAVAATLVLSLCACVSPSYYVDRTLGDVPPEKVRGVANPHPVQLLFEFQTKGTGNPRATDYLKAQVTESVQNSKMFSEVSATPVAGGALVSITINNVPLTDDAASKGFITGLTFGASGTTVTDGYTCDVNYVAAPGAPKLTKTTRHALITKIGATQDPPNADKAQSADEALHKITNQLVGNALNSLASDPAFR